MKEERKSEYLVCIIREDGAPVCLRPGGVGERDLVKEIVDRVDTEIVDRVDKSYTGIFISHTRVLELVKDAVKDVLPGAIRDVLATVKSEVVPRLPRKPPS